MIWRKVKWKKSADDVEKIAKVWREETIGLEWMEVGGERDSRKGRRVKEKRDEEIETSERKEDREVLVGFCEDSKVGKGKEVEVGSWEVTGGGQGQVWAFTVPKINESPCACHRPTTPPLPSCFIPTSPPPPVQS